MPNGVRIKGEGFANIKHPVFPWATQLAPNQASAQRPAYLIGYGAITAAGQGVAAMMASLYAGIDHSQIADVSDWPAVPTTIPRVCRIDSRKPVVDSSRVCMVRELMSATREAETMAWGGSRSGLRDTRQALGVIFASTKGFIDDVAWTARQHSEIGDTVTPIFTDFLQQMELTPTRQQVVAGACSSVPVAIAVAKYWLNTSACGRVLVVAADHVGPFVANGFAALNCLSRTTVTPFGEKRDGIQLGEAAIALIMAANEPSTLAVTGAAHATDGFAATRPNGGGDTLKQVVLSALEGHPVDGVIAHGTGTEANDAVEDLVFAEVFSQSVPVTGTKWSLGHSLGASGGIDVIAAAEILRRQKMFAIANTSVIDPKLRCPYLIGRNSDISSSRFPLRALLTSSLGFGGVHAALRIASLEHSHRD
jgi:3-oxoacyl-(acyl-carrier-protein) synthase